MMPSGRAIRFRWNKILDGLAIASKPIPNIGTNYCHVVGAIVGGRENNVEVEVKLGEAHHGPYGGRF